MAYPRKPDQKGGTLIAEDVWERSDHLQRLADPDGYRPESCSRCGGSHLHAHDFKDRLRRNDPEAAAEQVRRFGCADCGAVWRVLPAFLARHLHHAWGTVQAAMVQDGVLEPSGEEQRVAVPKRTRRRWRSRLRSSARVLTQALADVGTEVASVLRRLTVECSRRILIETLVREGLLAAGRKLGELAAWIHRVVPGVRLM
jgi:hypothetical protein